MIDLERTDENGTQVASGTKLENYRDMSRILTMIAVAWWN